MVSIVPTLHAVVKSKIITTPTIIAVVNYKKGIIERDFIIRRAYAELPIMFIATVIFFLIQQIIIKNKIAII